MTDSVIEEQLTHQQIALLPLHYQTLLNRRFIDTKSELYACAFRQAYESFNSITGGFFVIQICF